MQRHQRNNTKKNNRALENILADKAMRTAAVERHDPQHTTPLKWSTQNRVHNSGYAKGIAMVFEPYMAKTLVMTKIQSNSAPNFLGGLDR